jgi:hypothetical protein
MSDIEERLRAALHARAKEFTISPDAWRKTLARRGDGSTRTDARGGLVRWMVPLAAAAAVAAVALALVVEHGQPGLATAGSRTSTASPSPTVIPPSLSPTHAPAAKGQRVPTACGSTPAQPPAYQVTQVTPASMPTPAGGWFRQAPPVTGIVRVDVSYRGDRSVTYLWFTRQGHSVMLEHRIAALLSPAADLNTANWQGGGPLYTSIPPGQQAQQTGSEGNPLVTYAFGLASGQVAAVAMTTGGPLTGNLVGLFGGSTPVPGLVISGYGFPYQVWMAAFPATPLYENLVVRNAVGKTIGEQLSNPFPEGTMCDPLVSLDYEPPHGAYSFVTGASLPQVASVTAVLPDGSQVRGEFEAGGGVKTTQYYWFWTVTLPRKDANVTVTMLFKDAAGRVLGQFATVPGKNPFPPVKPVNTQPCAQPTGHGPQVCVVSGSGVHAVGAG